MVTLKDIAKQCGVSTATVSYVVNNTSQRVLPETRDRVLKAVAEMGYHPNAYARALKGVRSPVIGVVFPHVTVPFTNVYFGPVLEGIVAHATERRMATMLLTGLTWDETEQSLEKQFRGICDGFLLIAPRRSSRSIRDLAKCRFPVVTVGTQIDDPDVSSIDADNRAGGRMATEHLLALGHRRIGLVHCAEATTEPGVPTKPTVYSVQRGQGYLDALSDAGIEADPRLTAIRSEDPSATKSSFERLFEAQPTAIFGCNDGAALYAIGHAREIGLRTPEDLSVVGFDDIPHAANSEPPLTTIRQPVTDIGYRAVEMLCSRIEGNSSRIEHRVMPVELIPRRSAISI